MSPREKLNPFEKAQANHQKVTAQQPIGRAALLNSIKNLETTGKAEEATGGVSMADLAQIMNDTLSPIQSAEYTKPPLTTEQFSLIAGKLSVYDMISHANAPAPAVAQEPTDTKKIATGKRKA